jgi:hypothetical protein
MQISDEALKEVARLVGEGYMSGQLSSQDGEKIFWELRVTAWNREVGD